MTKIAVDVKEVTKVTNSPLTDSKGKKKAVQKGNRKELLRIKWKLNKWCD